VHADSYSGVTYSTSCYISGTDSNSDCDANVDVNCLTYCNYVARANAKPCTHCNSIRTFLHYARLR
jgi:hypothetical protein